MVLKISEKAFWLPRTSEITLMDIGKIYRGNFSPSMDK